MRLKIVTSLLLAWALIAMAIVTLFNASPDVQAAPARARTAHNVVVNYAPQTLSATGAQLITPTVSMYLLAPSALATYTLATGDAVAGDMLILVGSVATNTVLVDTGATGSGAARTIGNTDVWTGYYNGAVWVEQSFSDNS
jgi:hypothetical protein